MRKVFKNKAAFWLVVMVLILSIAIGIFNASKTDVSGVENVVKIVISPVQKLFTNMGHGISDFWGYFSDKDKLHSEIKKLEDENADLRRQISENEASRLENEQMRKLLNLKTDNYDFEFMAAEVIARSPSNWYNSITIDKGAADGIVLNLPVVSAGNSLVGRISEVGTTWSRITLLTDPLHAAGAQVLRSGEFGISEGDNALSTGGSCKLSFVSKNADMIVGDTVITSGLGGVYPKGLVIGKIQKIRTDIQGISQYAVIGPEADLKNLRAVFVIMNYGE